MKAPPLTGSTPLGDAYCDSINWLPGNEILNGEIFHSLCDSRTSSTTGEALEHQATEEPLALPHNYARNHHAGSPETGHSPKLNRDESDLAE